MPGILVQPKVVTWFVLAVACPSMAVAATFTLGTATPSFNGLAAASLERDGVTMQLEAEPAGATLWQAGFAGMGVRSSGIANVLDGNQDKFDLLGGSGPLAGSGEFIRFAFDAPGILTGIDFDGVKDELLEYFVLETAGGVRINFFDSAANTTMPGAVDHAIGVGAVTGEVNYLLELSALVDDEAQNLAIPFVAGQQFTLSYHELGVALGAQGPGNGARLQGVTIVPVPEPGTFLLAAVGGLMASRGRTRRQPAGTCRNP